MSSGRFGDLGPRVASGLAFAALAALALWAGGVIAAGFVTLLIVIVLWELHRMVTRDPRWVTPALGALGAAAVAAALLTDTAGIGYGLFALLAGCWLAALLAPNGAAWLTGGALYAGGSLCALLAVREVDGALAVVWLVLVVAAADIGAYFAGRSFGGPKLWPAVSPGKTWSGAVGGLVAAAVVAVVFALAAGWPSAWALGVGVVVAAASQAGDLLESAVKRRFGVKDSSQILPGHGGVMDRLDGIAAAACAYGIVSLIGGGGVGGS